MLALTPQDLGLPFPTWRSGQPELLTELAISERPITLLEAPTGSGKSAVLASLQSLLGCGALFLTSTKALQDQYAQTIPGMLAAKGRDNFPCKIEPWHSARGAPCGGCLYQNTPECEYYAQKIDAQHSARAVLNYQYWLNQANRAKQFRPVKLLVCDEAHLVEDELRRFIELRINWADLGRLYLYQPADLTVQGWTAWAQAQQETVKRKIAQYGSDERLQELYRAVRWLAAGRVDDDWTLHEDKYGIVFKPIWVRDFAKSLLFDHAERVVLMSGTILDKGFFCDSLGLPPETVEFIRVGSTFPAKARPLYYRPVGKVGMQHTAALDKLVKEIRDILWMHRDQRGIIHTGNYKLAEYIRQHIGPQASRLITHTSRTRGEVAAKIMASSNGVILSPSMTTGLDLPYDLCRFQIIAKLQFPDLSDPQVKKRKKSVRGMSWYTWQTACTLVQAYGRGMRAEDDACETYLLDGNFGGWFWAATRKMMPEWFVEAVQWPKGRGEYDDPPISVADQLRQAAGLELPLVRG